MRMWWLVVLAGCWTGPVAPPPTASRPPPAHHDVAPRSEFEDVLVRFEGIVDQMCDCHTQQCADGVAPEISALALDMSKRTDLHPTEAEQARVNSLSERYGQCVNNAMSAGPPNP